jgi:cytochrome o ubiquinol oxidase subunit 2
MLIVVIPVFVLTFGIAWKYRASNTKAKYSPDWDHNRTAETIWWLIPTAIIGVLAIITWQSSHDLDPYKALDSARKPVTVQVVALQWKWLFIYPEQGIASVNMLEFPEDTPVNFEITGDAPMNSFWIPQLGGQVYAMAGMTTKLHLMADKPGNYDGSSANLSGQGFAGMRFTAKAVTQADFDAWTTSMRRSPTALTTSEYNNLAKPSENNAVKSYVATEPDLYDRIIMKYMMPSPGAQGAVTQ